MAGWSGHAMRPFDPDVRRDKREGSSGLVVIQGEVKSGEFKDGEVKSSLAIRAGDLTIALDRGRRRRSLWWQRAGYWGRCG